MFGSWRLCGIVSTQKDKKPILCRVNKEAPVSVAALETPDLRVRPEPQEHPDQTAQLDQEDLADLQVNNLPCDEQHTKT